MHHGSYQFNMIIVWTVHVWKTQETGHACQPHV